MASGQTMAARRFSLDRARMSSSQMQKERRPSSRARSKTKTFEGNSVMLIDNIRIRSGLVIALSIAIVGTGCGTQASKSDDLDPAFRSTEDMVLSETLSVTNSFAAPVTVGPSAYADLRAFVQPFKVNNQATSNPNAIFSANTVTVHGADDSIIQLQRQSNKLLVEGSTEIGLQWATDFSQIVFHTPEGRLKMNVTGTLAQRKDMIATLAILGLTGDADQEDMLASASWAAGSLLGLAAISYVVVCLAYTDMCLDSAVPICADAGVDTVTVVCGGVRTTFNQGEAGIPTGVGLELGTLSCQIQCFPPAEADTGGECLSCGEDAGVPPVDVPDGWPVPTWDGTDSICALNAEPVPCSSTTVTYDTSGDIEEVTVTESDFGYCCP
jgi:hypothetical protein